MNKKSILCFGDSNTWGFVPGAFNPNTFYMERYPRDIRWPGVMEKALGINYHVIKEVLTCMYLYLGMEIPNWPPDNIAEMSKKLEEAI